MKSHLQKLAISGVFLLISTSPSWGTTDSTGISFPATTPGAPILMDTGYIDWPSAGGGSLQNFTTPPARGLCPPAFKPYFTITPTKLREQSGNTTQIISFGACIYNVFPRPPSYFVTYAVSKHEEVPGTFQNFSYGYFTGRTLYGSWNGANFEAGPDYITYNQTNFTPQTKYDSTGGLTWHYYCYPPSVPPPIDQSLPNPYCVPGSSPFN